MRNLKLFLVAILLFVGANRICAQDKWVNEGAEWYYNFISVFETTVWYQKFTYTSDTIIDASPSKVIEIEYPEEYLNSEHFPDQIYTKERGDTLFYRVRGAFHPLYNFSLALGDTMQIKVQADLFNNDDSIAYFTVDSLGTVSFDSTIYRTQFLTPVDKGASSYAISFSGWRIEGIGALQGLIPFHSVYCDHYCPFGLRCFTDDNTSYIRVQFDCDEVIIDSNTEDLMKAPAKVEAFPSPLEKGEQLTIQVKGMPQSMKRQLNIYNSNGRMIKSEMISGTSQIYINEYFTPGIYYVKIFSDTESTTARFVVF